MPAELIEQRGAVSEEVAEALARGAIVRFQAEWRWASPASPAPTVAAEDKRVGRVGFCVLSVEGSEERAWCARSICPVLAPTCAIAPPPWPFTCCDGCCSARVCRMGTRARA